jgi:DNA repair protein RadD
MLRKYQQKSIDQLYDWFRDNTGHPCLVLPTGSGKSHIVAALCKDAVQNWPETYVLMLTHVKELIEQNAEKMRLHWPNAPMGIYSASIGKRQLGESITFAGIQSVRNRASQIGHIDLCIIDECHLVSHNEEGGYRKLINELLEINPSMRVIGLSATPYRLGHGMITDKPALFDALIEPVSIEQLIYLKYLAPLRSKITKKKLSTEGVHKRGGEYIESELQAAVDNHDNNSSVVDEVISLAEDRKAWLFFCAGVDHAMHVKDILVQRGITAECITGKTIKSERKRILDDYKAGKIRALTNCDVLTTGFDYPDIDLIAMLRPTMSPSLYVQMAGRGLRPKSHTDHCLVLDFAGVVETHGPITNVKPPKKGGSGDGEAPIKVCDYCHEIVHISAEVCPNCGAEFPKKEEPKLQLRDIDIMGNRGTDMTVTSWNWQKAVSKTNGKEMICITYYGALSDKPVKEFLCLLHEGFAGNKARQLLAQLARNSKVTVPTESDINVLCQRMNLATPPTEIEYKLDGKYYRVMDRRY